MKHRLFAASVVILVFVALGGVFALIARLIPESDTVEPVAPDADETETAHTWFEQMPDRPAQDAGPDASGLRASPFELRKPYKLIGRSVEGREIQSYRYGGGNRTVLFVGAIHGGYEWNTALLAYEIVDHYIAYPAEIPAGVEVLVVPVLNPDGLFRVVGTSERFGLSEAPQFVFADQVLPTDVVVSGRFNAHGVDINRNFDCEWQPKAVWRQYAVSAGTSTFSEPEAAALRDFIIAERPDAVVFLQSGSDGLYASACGRSSPLPTTEALMRAYGEASGYTQYTDFAHYEVSGDAADWLASQGIPAFTVEMKTHNEIEWEQNKAGVEAMLAVLSSI